MLTSCNLTSLASRRRFLKLCVSVYQITHGTLNFLNIPVANRVLPAVNLRSYTPYLLYQRRIQKIFEGSSFGDEAHLPRKRRSLGASGGMLPPENFWKYGCSEVQFGAFLSRNRIATGLTISQTTLALHIALLLHCTWLFSSPAGD